MGRGDKGVLPGLKGRLGSRDQGRLVGEGTAEVLPWKRLHRWLRLVPPPEAPHSGPPLGISEG